LESLSESSDETSPDADCAETGEEAGIGPKSGRFAFSMNPLD
jgi:hypothetical protein